MSNAPKPWTPEDDELLRKLTLEGLSASMIAARMTGRTRNAVVGRWHRLNLKDGSQPKQRKKRSSNLPVKPTLRYRHHVAAATSAHVRALRSLEAKMRYAQTSKAMQDTEVETLNVELVDLHDLSCRWVVTADPPHLFCGRTKQDGSSYCPEHHARSRVSVPVQRRVLPTPQRRAA